MFPSSNLRLSEELTAEASQAKRSLYITSGTSSANQISLFATVQRGDKVLVDRTCHQSIHFALSLLGVEVHYMELNNKFEKLNRRFTNYRGSISQYKDAVVKKRPFKMVIINSCSYEGICCRSSELIKKMLKINSDVTFLVDEAWLAFSLFHEDTSHLSLLGNFPQLSKSFPKANFIITQSAHKSTISLRQGSYIHLSGAKQFVKKIEESKYKYHTTSPDFLILASLELAREDMILNGKSSIDSSIKLRKEFCEKIRNLSIFCPYDFDDVDYYYDPLKQVILFDEKIISPEELKEKFKIGGGVYISLVCESYFLVNFHIGICKEDVDKLVNLLREIDVSLTPTKSDSKVSDEFIIPYPPGVPIAVPGEVMTTGLKQRIEEYRHSGSRVVRVKKEVK